LAWDRLAVWILEMPAKTTKTDSPPKPPAAESPQTDDAIEMANFKLDASNFFARPTFSQLARKQGIKPLSDARQLAGGLPDDIDVDVLIRDTYRARLAVITEVPRPEQPKDRDLFG
jgi:hypothetical protein